MPDEEDYHPIAVGKTRFTDRFDEDAAATILDRVESSTAMMAVAQIRALGGAMARVPDDATAFAHRRSRFMVTSRRVYEQIEDTPTHQAWVDELAGALRSGRPRRVRELPRRGRRGRRPRGLPRSPRGTGSVRSSGRYDPDNLFRLNQNVPPA